jgi:hypothetical protein
VPVSLAGVGTTASASGAGGAGVAAALAAWLLLQLPGPLYLRLRPGRRVPRSRHDDPRGRPG